MNARTILNCVLIFLFAGCTNNTLPDDSTPAICGPFVVDENPGALTCIVGDRGLLIQSAPAEQTSLESDGWRITLNGLAYVNNETSTIITLEGTSVISAGGMTRVAQAGAQVHRDENGQPSIPIPYDKNLLGDAPFSQMSRPLLELPIPIAPPTGYMPSPTSTPTVERRITSDGTTTPSSPTPAGCVPREDWVDTHRVARGDTLSAIANRYGVTLSELQMGNCIENPDRLIVGQSVRVPANTPVPTPLPATFTPSAIAYRADETLVSVGQCTTIRWDVFNVSTVFFEDQPTTGQNARQVCPSATTEYLLRVVYPDGAQATRTLTIIVQP